MVEISGVLLVQNGEYVLQHRDDLPDIADPGMIGPWGGTVEQQDDSPAHAALRELKEETGVVCELDDLKHLAIYETEIDNRIIKVYLYSVELTEGIEVDCYEGKEVYRVKSINDVPANKRSDYLKRAIEAYEN